MIYDKHNSITWQLQLRLREREQSVTLVSLVDNEKEAALGDDVRVGEAVHQGQLLPGMRDEHGRRINRGMLGLRLLHTVAERLLPRRRGGW